MNNPIGLDDSQKAELKAGLLRVMNQRSGAIITIGIMGSASTHYIATNTIEV